MFSLIVENYYQAFAIVSSSIMIFVFFACYSMVSQWISSIALGEWPINIVGVSAGDAQRARSPNAASAHATRPSFRHLIWILIH